MDEMELLRQRLAELEGREQGRGFMDKYGAKFNGDEGIGTAILAELNRRGVDTSAADEAVQEIIDNLRQDASALLDKLTQVEEAVQDAINGGGAPPAIGGEMPPEMGMEGMPGEEASPPEGPPPEEGMAGAPEGSPPEGSEAPPPEEQGMLSDARYKDIRPTILSDERLKSIIPGLDDETCEALKALGGIEDLEDEDILEALDLLQSEEGGDSGDLDAQADAFLGDQGSSLGGEEDGIDEVAVDEVAVDEVGEPSDNGGMDFDSFFNDSDENDVDEEEIIMQALSGGR
jgi:hypothetical protein